MPFKFHEPRRHGVPKARYRVTNWPGYDRGLVGRGDLRRWIADGALAAWAAPSVDQLAIPAAGGRTQRPAGATPAVHRDGRLWLAHASTPSARTSNPARCS
jgi:hypothetical protein